MKTTSKIYKNKNHEYESDRKQQETMCTQYTRHKYVLTNASNSFQTTNKKAWGKDMYENGNRVLEKAKTIIFYFKNGSLVDIVGV